MDNGELIKRLRDVPCWDIGTEIEETMLNAADALEALQARADKQDAEITELLAVITKNDTEMDALKTELLNAQDEAKYERQRLRLCEENLEATMVSETTYREMCESLRKQLRESNENYEKHINELEAQLPKEGECEAKKPKTVKETEWSFYCDCPTCRGRLISNVDGEWCAGSFDRFCRMCGQKIDWSEYCGWSNKPCGADMMRAEQ